VVGRTPAVVFELAVFDLVPKLLLGNAFCETPLRAALSCLPDADLPMTKQKKPKKFPE
jgi:hypothetical protein